MFRQALLVIFLTTHFALLADVSQGELLERQFWEDIKAKKWAEVEAHIAGGFQETNLYGVQNKEHEVEIFKKLAPHEIVLSEFKVTEGQDIFIVTYVLQISETLNNKRLISKNLRISVWQKNNSIWQWVAHANLTSPPQ